MSVTVQIRRGNVADLPTLDNGELGLAEDTNTVYIGDDGSKVLGKLKKSYRAIIEVDWGAGGTLSIDNIVNSYILENTIGTVTPSLFYGTLRFTATNSLTSQKVFVYPSGINDTANTRFVRLFTVITNDDTIDYTVDAEESVGSGDSGYIYIAIDVYY